MGVAYGPTDLIGGFSDHAGATVLSTVIDHAASVAIQPRNDRVIQVFSFDRFDLHQPFTLIAPLDSIINPHHQDLKQHFADPNHAWAAILIGVIKIMLDQQTIAPAGFNLAIQSTTTSLIAIGVATVRAVNQMADNTVTDLASVVHDAMTTIVGIEPINRDITVCVSCNPGTILPINYAENKTLPLINVPAGVQLMTVDVPHDDTAWAIKQMNLRVAAAMGHKLILAKMKQIGAAAGRELISDPTNGYLCNLPLDDYRRFFRSFLPETLKGGTFMLEHGKLVDPELRIRPDQFYPIQPACDFHVFGANRVKNFIQSLHAAYSATDENDREKELNKAGHLLYASQKSLVTDADLINLDTEAMIESVRRNELSGYYGAGPTRRGIVILAKKDAPIFDPAPIKSSRAT